jgi:hypothetical protein
MRRLIPALLAALAFAGPALAEPTSLVVRVQSRDAKFIGDHMGGVAVRLTDAATGKLLAEGLTAGGTGDTERLVVQPRGRGATLSAEGDAAFKTVLDLDRPTLVKLEAKGPMGHPGAVITVTSMAWVLPGQPVVGDGWVVEFPGLAVDTALDRTVAGKLTITAKVTLMCGCPVTPGGLWDANGYTVTAWVTEGGKAAVAVPLAYAGEASTFRATIPAPGPSWSLQVTAVDAKSGNTGVGGPADPER